MDSHVDTGSNLVEDTRLALVFLASSAPRTNRTRAGVAASSFPCACAFWNNDLTSVTIPDSVTRIGTYAFAENVDLSAVFFERNAPEIAAAGELGSLGTREARRSSTADTTTEGLFDFEAPVTADLTLYAGWRVTTPEPEPTPEPTPTPTPEATPETEEPDAGGSDNGNPDAELPATGSTGVIALWSVGTLLVLSGAGIALVRRRAASTPER